jgi:DNA-binding PadR family transcriptional regulator
LLKIFASQPLTALECMKRLKLVHRPTFRANYLTPALNAKFIERTIPDKPNSRLQKYRLTDKGRARLEE